MQGVCDRRLEEDKFNVWLAYLNLENTYGEPPEDAALALFQRAAQVFTRPVTPAHPAQTSWPAVRLAAPIVSLKVPPTAAIPSAPGASVMRSTRMRSACTWRP